MLFEIPLPVMIMYKYLYLPFHQKRKKKNILENLGPICSNFFRHQKARTSNWSLKKRGKRWILSFYCPRFLHLEEAIILPGSRSKRGTSNLAEPKRQKSDSKDFEVARIFRAEYCRGASYEERIPDVYMGNILNL